MVQHEVGTHSCIVCGVHTLPSPDSVGFAFAAYRGTTDGICSDHAKQDLLEVHGGSIAGYRAALEAGGFTVVERNLLRLLAAPPGATCTKKVYEPGNAGIGRGQTCGRKAKVLEGTEPRCGIHDPAKKAAFAAQRTAQVQARVAALDRTTQRQRLFRDALEVLKASKGQVSAGPAWLEARDGILRRAETLEA